MGYLGGGLYFADPFSSFGGEGSLERFRRNAKNLGGLVVNPIGKVRSFVK